MGKHPSSTKSELPGKECYMYNNTFLDLNLLVCSDCWKPEREAADDDLKYILLSASDFCRCVNKSKPGRRRGRHG